MTGVFAPAGTFIPGTGVQLEKGVIRGVESNGMLLSERELGVSDDHEGIVDLPADAPVGQPYAVYAGLDDPVIDVAVTPNRPDALGVAGIARDLSAAGIGYLIERPVVPVPGDGPCPVKVDARFRRHAARSASPSACGWCAASGTARRRPGCRSACAPSASGRSTRWSISPISSPTTATARCTSSTPPRSRAISPSAAPATARSCWRSTAAPTRSIRPCASSPTRTASSRSPASWAASSPAARRRPPTCSSNRRCGSRSTSPRPAASSASTPTPAIATSAASIRPSTCRASSSPRRWSWISAAEARARCSSPARSRSRSTSSSSRSPR